MDGLNEESLLFIKKKEECRLIKKALSEMTVEEARADVEARCEALKPDYAFSGVRKEIFVPHQDWSGQGIPVFVYTPKHLKQNPPIWVYFHGGGFVFGSRMLVDSMCKMVADMANCIVVNSEYRLLPEHQFPANVDDALHVTQWVMSNKALVGGADGSIVGVGGDSAGGTLAASAAHDIPGLGFQVLIYGAFCGRTVDLPSRKEQLNTPGLSKEALDFFGKYNPPKKENAKNPRLHAYFRERFDTLPPTLFVVAECDFLRDDSYEYSKKLTGAGVANQVFTLDGVMHGFFAYPGIYKDSCSRAYDKVSEFIKTY